METARFLTRLSSDDLEGPDVGKWLLTKPLIYYSAILGRHIVMRPGEIADSYSVPRMFAWLVFGIDRRPAFIHDHLYAGREPGVTRAQADRILLEAMASTGVPLWLRRIIFRGPNAFGWLFFKGQKQPVAEEDEQPLDHSPGA
jgi:hypothetical protein